MTRFDQTPEVKQIHNQEERKFTLRAPRPALLAGEKCDFSPFAKIVDALCVDILIIGHETRRKKHELLLSDRLLRQPPRAV